MSEVLVATTGTPPPSDQLMADWAHHHAVAASDLISVDQPLAVLRRPGEHEKPKAVLSLDRDEVLHMTGGACIAYYTGDASWSERLTNQYELAGIEDGTISTNVRHVTNNHLALPIANYLDIAQELREMRAAGVYIVATTAIISGCESAVAQSLAQHYKGGFDGVIFSRGHLEVTSTKPRSLISALGAVGITLGGMPVGHIDDSSRHVHGFLNAADQFGSVHVAMPMCEGEPHDDELEIYRTENTYEAIKRIREGMGI